MVFSANLQETLGISCYEGAIVDAIPMVPDRLSYSEMYYDTFKYPSVWTEDYAAYEAARPALCYKIMQYMKNYDQFKFQVRKQTTDLTNNFFSANRFLEMIK